MSVYNKGDQFERQTQFGDATDIPVGQAPRAEDYDGGDDAVVEDKKAEQPAVRQEAKRKDRAKQRIQQLSSQKNAAEQEAANYKRMYEEALNKSQNESKAN